jgi:predicted RNA-binding protein associated with RNAse of E/G family
MERRKYLGKPHEDYIKSSCSKIIKIDDESIKGYFSYLKIIEVNRPFIVGLKDNEICLYDKGYSEINYLPDNENWQLYGIYDNHGKIIEWYFDVTKKNTVDNEGNPYCDDLFLDIVLLPNGQIIILDEDELQNAYDEGIITYNEYNLAYKVKNKLINDGIVNVNYLEKLCNRLLEKLKLNE